MKGTEYQREKKGRGEEFIRRDLRATNSEGWGKFYTLERKKTKKRDESAMEE